MKIRAGYEISYDCSQPTPMILTLSVYPSRTPDLLGAAEAKAAEAGRGDAKAKAVEAGRRGAEAKAAEEGPSRKAKGRRGRAARCKIKGRRGDTKCRRNPSGQKARGNGYITGRFQAQQGHRSEADGHRVAEAKGAKDDLCARTPAPGAGQAKSTKLSRALS
jgi:hypothetical protein